MRKFAFIALLCCLAALAFAARCHRLRDVFIDGKIYFTDADCYSRMTRARMVSEGAALTIRHHEFENWPHGVTPHTTAPLDWLIAGLGGISDFGFRISDSARQSVLRPQSLDLAGALVGPLLGMIACGVIALSRRSWWSLAGAGFVAVSPILVHGTSLGRPDHQALLITLLAAALAIELRLLSAASYAPRKDSRNLADHAPRRGSRKLAGGNTPGKSASSESTPDGVEERADTPSRTPSGVHSSCVENPGLHPGLISGGPSGALSRRAFVSGSIVAGVLWGVALWVSLYEPLVLLALTLLGLLIAKPSAFRDRARWWQWGATALVVALAVLVDGWRVSVPPPELRDAFARWKLTISELRGADFTAILRWLGAACVLAPVALGWQWKRPEARWLLVLLAVTFALTCWQLRWGYFLALVYALSLPTLVEAMPRRRWIEGVIVFAGLWPMAQEWDTALFTDDPATERARAVQRLELKSLREIAEAQGERKAGPFLAPWWLSPSIAYWSRQPGVAGSSHQSLPGILDSARVWLAPDEAAALPILHARQVAWVVVDAPERTVPTSATLLGIPPPERTFAHELMETAPRDPTLPRQEHEFFKVWRVGK